MDAMGAVGAPSHVRRDSSMRSGIIAPTEPASRVQTICRCKSYGNGGGSGKTRLRPDRGMTPRRPGGQ